MRRMRDLPWRYYLLAIPAVAAALGIQYMIRKWHPGSSNPEMASALKPSFFKENSGAGSEYDGSRKLASKQASGSAKIKAPITPVSKNDMDPKPKKIESAAGSPDTGDTFDAVEEGEEDLGGEAALAKAEAARQNALTESEKEAQSEKSRFQPTMVKLNAAKSEREETVKPAAAPASAPASASAPAQTQPQSQTLAQEEPLDSSNVCTSVEYRGDGPEHTKVTKEEWAKVMKQFHGAKGDLLSWLKKHRREFPDRTYEIMETQVLNLKIQRPPTTEEPDLSWRGIGIWTQDNTGAPILRVGNGMVKLIHKQPARGKFEMARLVAQAWAPCELIRVDAAGAWDPLLKCLKVNEENACAAGSYSESGWAISSAMAAIVAPPGCSLGAFNYASVAQCLKKVPLPLSMADSGVPMNPNWKEARR